MKACCEERVWDGNNLDPRDGDRWCCPRCGKMYEWDATNCEWIIHMEADDA